jgi:hypothetical protein
MQTKITKRATCGIAGAVAMVLLTGAAQAAFEGRNATGAADNTCTATGVGKCVMFYDTTLDITILNNWNIGQGTWNASAASGSAQALAAAAGFNVTGLTGWVLPTGNAQRAPGAENQYLSIWNSVGSTLAGLSGQFDGAVNYNYWSGTEFAPNPTGAWSFYTNLAHQDYDYKLNPLHAVAVRPGDVAAVPEPETGAMMLVALGAFATLVRRRPR